VMEREPQHVDCFPADFRAGVVQLCGNVGSGLHSGLGTRQVVGNVEAVDHLVTVGLTYHKQGYLTGVDIGTYAQSRLTHESASLSDVTQSGHGRYVGAPRRAIALCYRNSGAEPEPHGTSMRA